MDDTTQLNYKNILLLRNSITISGKIIPKRLNHLNLTTKGQRSISKAIKNARLIGFLPFARLIGNPLKSKYKKNRNRNRKRKRGAWLPRSQRGRGLGQ
uniref:Small ribosomal subunit protein bS18c n=1 Tax=Rhipiliopsis peltata TaxID=2320810 RepID=A0A386B1E0_9CHLO|nr:ribosomal protein S18 [Rhipiliopsis peltata]AYC65512.1 ribosomal protein S18 [Rhipiliopsis peltata]